LQHQSEFNETGKKQQDLIATMVSSVVDGLAVAETPPDMADSTNGNSQMMPSGASKPLIGTS
jgi:hypothetical protein